MTRAEKAVDIYKQTFNCSQAVFTAFRQAEQLDEVTALKLSTVFGAGMARTGNTCGAVCGALMAISMKHGRGDVSAVPAKEKTYQLGQRFMDEFARKNGSCVCAELLGMNISDPANMAKAAEMKLFQTKCLELVRSAGEILESVIDT
jgi:C_GCAxxG_C_C family probable redox protein